MKNVIAHLDNLITSNEAIDNHRSYSQALDPYERGYVAGLRAARRIVAEAAGDLSVEPAPLARDAAS